MKLFYRKFGQGNPFIILHGLYGSSDNWITIARELAQKYEVWLPDLRNHGRSPHREEHNYDSMSDDLLEFITDHNIQKPIIMGHSMGGKLAMNFAFKHQSLISHLIVVDIAPKSYLFSLDIQSDTLNHGTIIESMLSINFSNISKREQLDEILSKSIKNLQIRQFLLKNVKRNHDNSFSWSINLEALQKNLNRILEGFEYSFENTGNSINEIPVLFIKGANSEYITIDDEEFIKRLFPYAKIVKIEGAGHWVHADQPGMLIKSINDFVDAKH